MFAKMHCPFDDAGHGPGNPRALQLCGLHQRGEDLARKRGRGRAVGECRQFELWQRGCGKHNHAERDGYQHRDNHGQHFAGNIGRRGIQRDRRKSSGHDSGGPEQHHSNSVCPDGRGRSHRELDRSERCFQFPADGFVERHGHRDRFENCSFGTDLRKRRRWTEQHPERSAHQYGHYECHHQSRHGRRERFRHQRTIFADDADGRPVAFV